MPVPLRLADIQRQFAAAAMRPLDARQRTQRRWSDGRATAAVVDPIVKPNDRLTSLQRLEIYNRQYWFRLWDCLSADFPGVETILGETRFRQLATEYLTAHPSTSFTLRNLGKALPDYIAQNLAWRRGLTDERQRMAEEMARFEWAQIEAFDGPKLPPVQVDELLGQDPRKLKLRLQPSMSLLELHWALDDFAIALKKSQPQQQGREAATESVHGPRAVRLPKAKHVYLAVHRLENGLYYKRLSRAAYLILCSLRDGSTLGEALENAAALVRKSPEKWATDCRAWFTLWSRLGWFTRSARRRGIR